MKSHNQTSSLFWLIFSMAVCFGSVHLGIGTIRNPGMGLMPFAASVLLAALSLVLFFQAVSERGKGQAQAIFHGVLVKRVFIVLLALSIYSKLMPWAGYLISTFLLMTLLFWIVEKKEWWRVLLASFLTTLITYSFFSKLLNCQFPDGLFGF